MTTYVEIAVNVPQVSDVFHYHLPVELEGKIQPGHLVVVPFGKQTVQGVILRQVERPSIQETRPVLELVDSAAVLTSQQIELAGYLSKEYLAPLAACIALMLPPGLEQQADLLYTASGMLPEGLTEAQHRLLHLLIERGALRGQQIDRSLPRMNWRSAARALQKRGLLTSQMVLPAPKVRPKIVRKVQLTCTPEQAQASMAELARLGTPALERRQAALRFLLDDPGPVDVAWVYAASGAKLDDLKALEARRLVGLSEGETLRDPLSQFDFQPYHAPRLTAAQHSVWELLQSSLRQAAAGQETPPMLLHGVTGSGKTELYLRAVQEMLDLERQAIILVPEIALTPQTVQRFVGRFPGRVGLIHSGLSAGERYDTWRRARSGELSLVVGPRSALFTPFDRLGLIVIDESHDDSYYQSESPPYYHAREAAIAYARLVNAACLMGTATPDLVSAYRSQAQSWQVLRLPERILAHRAAVRAQIDRLNLKDKLPEGAALRFRSEGEQAEALELPQVTLVDMRRELQEGNRSIFSRVLTQGLNLVLERSQQAILFLNRRGSATFVFCRDCGHIMKCSRCDLPLTFHEMEGVLRCHTCNYQRRMPPVCPQCKSQRIRQYGTGTQRVEAEVQALFPQARTLRWDHETTRTKGAHEKILSQFSAHEADILVGTQMLAKGLDLPFVTLVGIVLADVGLSLPDYRTNERAFQVLTQVVGRAGRSLLGGEAILQTFQPEHYVLQAVAQHDYPAFYQQELAFRRQLGYPPFTALVRLEFRHLDAARAEQGARELAAQVQRWIQELGRTQTRLLGPAPCFFARAAGMYRWQIIVAGPDPVSLLRGRNLTGWRVEVNPPSLL